MKCKECGQEKKIKARERCLACYQRLLYRTDPDYRARKRASVNKWKGLNPLKCLEMNRIADKRRREALTDREVRKYANLPSNATHEVIRLARAVIKLRRMLRRDANERR